MKVRKYGLILMILAILSFSASARAIPKQSPKKNFHARKKKITVESLKEKYGKPAYHLKFDEEFSETLVNKDHEEICTIYFDEEIAFTIDDDWLAVYYFSNGKLLASALKAPAEKSISQSSPEEENDGS